MSCSAAAVSSSAVPAGMSTTSWNSLLLSKGSIFSTTHCTAARPTLSSQRGQDAGQQQPALLRAVAGTACSSRVKRRDRRPGCGRARQRVGPCAAAPCDFISFSASQGVTVNAIASDERHAQAAVDRDRAHVRAHQAADEGHRQQRRDHRQRGQDGRAADLVDRRRDDLAQRLARLQLLVAVDVLDHHDGVVDQDADARRSARTG